MRKLLLTLLVLLLAVPAVGAAALMRKTGDGTLSVEDGTGRVVLIARGGVIGRFDSGSVTIQDRTPNDAFEPKVWGATRLLGERVLGDPGERWSGTNVRFRLIGGEFRIVIVGRGIDLSAVGNGNVFLEGEGRLPGVYSLDGEDCSGLRVKCKELPDPGKRFVLGEDAPDRGTPARPLP